MRSRAASRVRLRRAAPALDPARGAGANHRTGIDSARLTPPIKVGPTPADRPRAQTHREREGAVGNEAIDGRPAKACGLDDGRQARTCGLAYPCVALSRQIDSWGVCSTMTRNSRRGLAVAKRRITAKNHRVRSISMWTAVRATKLLDLSSFLAATNRLERGAPVTRHRGFGRRAGDRHSEVADGGVTGALVYVRIRSSRPFACTRLGRLNRSKTVRSHSRPSHRMTVRPPSSLSTASFTLDICRKTIEHYDTVAR